MDWLRSQRKQHTFKYSYSGSMYGATPCVKLPINFIVYSEPDYDRPTTEAATPHSSQPPAGNSLYEPV